MQKIIGVLLSSWLSVGAFSCTTFCIHKNGQLLFGRNYDWITGAGIVSTNHRGLFKTSLETGEEKKISWISKYGSITFNQYGKEFPTGGMNEKGLVVELMWLDETRYPSNDARPSVNVLQWIQYQLDNASNTQEVIASDARLRIAANGTPLHYLVADASGAVATIEFLQGKIVVHQGKDLPFPVLTNSTYQESSQTASSSLKNKNSYASKGNSSLDRFVNTCKMIEKLKASDIKTSLTNFAFSILDEVAQGDYTKWSIVYDITNKKIHFKTKDAKNIKEINFSSFDFSCASPSKMFDMNAHEKGNISSKFTMPDAKVKKDILEKAVRESASRVTITDKRREEILAYEKLIQCK